MKWFPLTITLLACLTAAGAQNLTGRWIGPATTADDGLEFVLALNQASDGSLTGYIQSRVNDRITAGTVEGSRFTLEAERAGRGGAIQKVTYTGALEGGKIKLTLPAG